MRAAGRNAIQDQFRLGEKIVHSDICWPVRSWNVCFSENHIWVAPTPKSGSQSDSARTEASGHAARTANSCFQQRLNHGGSMFCLLSVFHV